MASLHLMPLAASLPGGMREWADIGASHAATVAANHFRRDGSTYHLAIFDPTTGERKWRGTHQGYADNSTWARQALGMASGNLFVCAAVAVQVQALRALLALLCSLAVQPSLLPARVRATQGPGLGRLWLCPVPRSQRRRGRPGRSAPGCRQIPGAHGGVGRLRAPVGL